MRRGFALSFARHCERSEAIQSRDGGSGLLRRFAPRNDSFCILCAALLICSPALAEPRSIDDCEAIKEADAYNLCLASFGPTRAQKVKSYPGMAGHGTDHDASGVGAPKATQRRIPNFGGHTNISHSRNGRVHMEFTPRAR